MRESENHLDLRRCVPMSREEEHQCALEYVRTKDPVFAQRLVVANMRMVVTLARYFCRVDGDLADFIQEGNRGLLMAVDRYDPTRGTKFCTYAVWWIRSYILNFTMNNWRLVKVGTTQAQRRAGRRLRGARPRGRSAAAAPCCPGGQDNGRLDSDRQAHIWRSRARRAGPLMALTECG
jgi:RNA polymerase sigma factor (sigma-70 family)